MPDDYKAFDVFLCKVQALIKRRKYEGYELLLKIVLYSYSICTEANKDIVVSIVDMATSEAHRSPQSEVHIWILIQCLMLDVPVSQSSIELIPVFLKSYTVGHRLPCYHDEIFGNIALLHHVGKLHLDSGLISKMIDKDNFPKLILNTADFNFEKFNIDWIHSLPEDLVNSILLEDHVLTMFENQISDCCSVMPNSWSLQTAIKFIFKALKSGGRCAS